MGRAGQGLREEGTARDTHWKEAEEVREALRMQLAGLERPEAEGQRLEWKQAWAKAGCSLRVWAEGCGEVELSGTGWAGAQAPGSSQLLEKAEAVFAGASLGYGRTRGHHSQTSLPASRRIWVTNMCAVSQVRGLLGD